jgi:hypothetical protein
LGQIYKFPQSSLAELARNSVIQSGFEMQVKRHWLGNQWYLPGAAGNDIHKARRIIHFSPKYPPTPIASADERAEHPPGVPPPDAAGGTEYDQHEYDDAQPREADGRVAYGGGSCGPGYGADEAPHLLEY